MTQLLKVQVAAAHQWLNDVATGGNPFRGGAQKFSAGYRVEVLSAVTLAESRYVVSPSLDDLVARAERSFAAGKPLGGDDGGEDFAVQGRDGIPLVVDVKQDIGIPKTGNMIVEGWQPSGTSWLFAPKTQLLVKCVHGVNITKCLGLVMVRAVGFYAAMRIIRDQSKEYFMNNPHERRWDVTYGGNAVTVSKKGDGSAVQIVPLIAIPGLLLGTVDDNRITWLERGNGERYSPPEVKQWCDEMQQRGAAPYEREG